MCVHNALWYQTYSMYMYHIGREFSCTFKADTINLMLADIAVHLHICSCQPVGICICTPFLCCMKQYQALCCASTNYMYTSHEVTRSDWEKNKKIVFRSIFSIVIWIKIFRQAIYMYVLIWGILMYLNCSLCENVHCGMHVYVCYGVWLFRPWP